MIKINVKKPTADDRLLAAWGVSAAWLNLQRAMLAVGDDGPSRLLAAEDLAFNLRLQEHVGNRLVNRQCTGACPGCKIAKGDGKVQP